MPAARSASRLTRPRLSYNVAIYHRTFEKELRMTDRDRATTPSWTRADRLDRRPA